MIKNRIWTAGNFNEDDEVTSVVFLEQLAAQYWLPQEIPMALDLPDWERQSQEVKDAYVRNLQVLTTLDSWQGDLGMNAIASSMPAADHLKKAVFSFMSSFENAIHAKSYSTIYQTYLNNNEIDELFLWGEQQEYLQEILNIIGINYSNLEDAVYEYKHNLINEDVYKEIQYKAMASSVFLETFLFYTGFYYPLWFYGQGKLMQAGEIINLIIRDEVVHGLYTGLVAQNILTTLPQETQDYLDEWLYETLDRLYELECSLIEEIYDSVGLTDDVKSFIRYNANKALMNLGKEPHYEDEEINPIVLRGLDTKSKTHDFFSMKGNAYTILETESLDDDDFNFDF